MTFGVDPLDLDEVRVEVVVFDKNVFCTRAYSRSFDKFNTTFFILKNSRVSNGGAELKLGGSRYSLRRFCIGIKSCMVWDNAIYSALVVEREISV